MGMKSMGNLPEAGVGEVGQITILKVPEDLMILYSGSYLLEILYITSYTCDDDS